MSTSFDDAYKGLNAAQREAVDIIEGPVMVIAGPGTGKTQVLAIRIANILQKTDTQSDGILCLTFTNSGVRAMRERLRSYIGPVASRVEISTFHSFAMKMIEEFAASLGYFEKPMLVDDIQSVALCDAVLDMHDFKHLRSRANKALYFYDIKSLVSLLKRERMTPESFQEEIKKEISFLENDESNISSRGSSKGQLKQEAVKKIESLERTLEIVTFYELYESLKREKNFLDYDDVLSELVRLVEISEDARATIRERYLYVLVDEHQDSSGVQNDFLKGVWGDIEKPNVFVVGDDRQLIYGFGGASLSYFEGFKDTFDGVKLITLTENYRSTQKILDAADTLLQSSLSEGPLVSHHPENHALRSVEANYPRDEILRAGLEIKDLIVKGMSENECVILVPKNTQVKNAMRILRDLGIPVAGNGMLKLFEIPEAQSFLNILRALAHPAEPAYIAPLLLDPLLGIPPLVAHGFLVAHDPRKLTLSKLLEEKETLALFPDDNAVVVFAKKLSAWLLHAHAGDVYGLVQKTGDEFLISSAKNHDTLVRRVEIVRSFLHLVLSQTEKNPHVTLVEFLDFVDRLEEYGADVPLAVFGSDDGVRVMTLHGSKGLEFDYVWIAHADQKNLLGKKSGSFTLPELVKTKIEEKDEQVVKRELYVAITRAKRFCTISYAMASYTGGAQELAHVVADLGDGIFERIIAAQTEEFIASKDISLFAKALASEHDPVTLEKLAELVSKEYSRHSLSVTHLNNFFECPWKWYFRNLLRLPEPKSISLEFGNLVHGLIEKILKGNLVPNEKAVTDAIETALEKIHGFDDAVLKGLKKDALAVVMRWVTERLPHIAENHESEKSLSYRDPQFDHLLMTGKIDLVESLGNNSVRVTDFKTGSVKKKTEIEKDSEEGRLSDYHRQLAMYSYLLNGTTRGDVQAWESCLEFLEAKPDAKDAIYATEIVADDIVHLKKDIADFDQLLSSGEWVNRPCYFKSFKSNDECEYCKLAKMYKN